MARSGALGFCVGMASLTIIGLLLLSGLADCIGFLIPFGLAVVLWASCICWPRYVLMDFYQYRASLLGRGFLNGFGLATTKWFSFRL